MKKVELGKTGEKVPVVGQGTWGISWGKSPEHYEQWKTSLKRGIELGMTHIDTAEAYGYGKAETTVGEVTLNYPRDSLFITSKVFPLHMTHNGMKKAAYKSLERLNLDHFDLYLIHWPIPFISMKKMMRVLEELVREGKTRYIGVSNFSVKQFIAAQEALKREELVTNQVRASILRQDHIRTSLPYYQKVGVTLTAYSPLGHRGLTGLRGKLRENLESIASRHKATIQQIALAWLVCMKNVIAIPKALKIAHVEANAKAAEITLTEEEMKMLTTKFL